LPRIGDRSGYSIQHTASFHGKTGGRRVIASALYGKCFRHDVVRKVSPVQALSSEGGKLKRDVERFLMTVRAV
jgi:hypothetical protein